MPYKEIFLKKAYDLAETSRGKTSPNPFVGCVIVKDGKIVGEGSTQPYGCDHAEIQAIKMAGKNCRNAEMYVTLEPCAHFGKTPPCVDAIKKNGISAVYAGILDPNPLVNGKGFHKLKKAGIHVEYGYWKEKITKQLEYYLTSVKKHRPFIIIKNAVSLDGNIATSASKSKWITSQASRKRVHALRDEVDAVITGINTVLCDDPMLNVRLENKNKDPLRIILDSSLRIPFKSQIVQTAKEIKTMVITSIDTITAPKEEKLKQKGVEILKIDNTKTGLDLLQLIQYLHKKKISSIMIEAGAELSSSFIKSGMVDKYFYFIAPKIIGGNKSVFSEYKINEVEDSIKLKIDSIERYDKDLLIIGYGE